MSDKTRKAIAARIKRKADAQTKTLSVKVTPKVTTTVSSKPETASS